MSNLYFPKIRLKFREKLSVSILLTALLLVSLCLAACQKNEIMTPENHTRRPGNNESAPENSEKDNPDDGDEISYDVGSLARRIGELPDVDVQAEEAPASLTGHWYTPSIETIFEVLMKDRTLEDFTVTTEPLYVTADVYSNYVCMTDASVFSVSRLGDFSFSLDQKLSSDIDLVVGMKHVSSFCRGFVEEKDFFSDSSLSIMEKDQAVALAQTALARLGYGDIVLQDVLALHHEKILEKTLEQKRAAEEFKKKNPGYEMYDYRTDWNEEDGKYVMYFLSLGSHHIPPHESGTLMMIGEFPNWLRCGTLICCFAGQRGLEHIEVRSFYQFDEPSAAKTKLLSREEMSEKINELYMVQPEVSSFELAKIRLRYLPEKFDITKTLPNVLSFMPVYTCTVVEKTEKTGADVCIGSTDFVFNAITGEPITDTIFR